jgi:hypothetical protein
MRWFIKQLGRLLVFVACATPTLAETPRSAEAVDLLRPAPTRDDLGRWAVFSESPTARFADTWHVDQGTLVCRGRPRGYLYTKEKYADFVLTFQYRLPREAKPHKGGVLIRMTGKHAIWPKCLEAQINHPDAGDFWGLAGYRLDGPAERKKTIAKSPFGALIHLAKMDEAARPIGAWNDYTIRAVGGTVTLTLNGRLVNRATGCDVTAGPILLTAEGNEIHFRKLRLINLRAD